MPEKKHWTVDIQYHHPVEPTHEHDYRHDMHELDDHIKKIVHNGYHKGHVQHLGSAASLHDHLMDLHYGQARMIKKELKRVIDYLYMYADTGHEIYCFMADDALKHVTELYEDISDVMEKEHVRQFLTYVEDYMEWLRDETAKKNDNQMAGMM